MDTVLFYVPQNRMLYSSQGSPVFTLSFLLCQMFRFFFVSL